MIITYSLPDAAELEAAWAKAPAIVREEMEAAMEWSLTELTPVIQDLTPKGVYEALQPSIIAQPIELLSDQVIGVVGTSISYAEAVELGTKPHFPPVEALEDWVVKKLGVDEKRAHAVAFLVARKISLYGTPAVGMFHRGLNQMKAAIAQRFEEARNQIVKRLAQQGSAA